MAETKGYIKTSDEKGSVNISQSVVATIAAAAAVDVDGVNGLYQSPGKETADVSGKSGKKGVSKGVKVTLEESCINLDIFVIATIGSNVSEVAVAIQSAVKSAIEEATGSKVGAVNVHICGVSHKRIKAGNNVPHIEAKSASQQ